MPHADGVFLKDNPEKLVLEGSVASIPFVVGQSSLYGARVQETAYASHQDLARMKERCSPLLLSISREPYRFGIYQSEGVDTTFLGPRRRSRRT